LCDICARTICDGTEQYATVPDSSAVRPAQSFLDGQRQLTACCAAHLDELIDQYRARPYDEAELWAQIVTRAQRRMGHEADIDDLAFMTGLTIVQLMRALRWQSIWMQWLPDGKCVR
jgi:hypothetical protein